MVIECPYCEAYIECEELASVSEDLHQDMQGDWINTALCKCTLCKKPLIGSYYSRDYNDGEGISCDIEAKRLWPQFESIVPKEIPQIVRYSIVEAKKCFKSKAYSACAVMCGRALEGVCKHYKTEKQSLGPGLKELLEKKIIDNRLHEWSEELRKRRNLGAHPNDEKISKADASYILDFTNAICDYIFILSEKFQKFMSSKDKEI